MRTAIIICSYNMPEYTDALCEHINNTVSRPHELVVVDNGSDLVDPSKYTTFKIENNVQMVRGFMRGLDTLKKDYDAYWLLTTSCRFDPNDKRDPLSFLLPIFKYQPLTYAIQPSLHIDFGAWKEFLAPRSPAYPRRVWGLEYVCTLFRAKYFDELGRWNENLPRGWGIAAESQYLARKAGLHLYTQDAYPMYKDTQIGYKMGRMSESAVKRGIECKKECDQELIPKYGEDYLEFLNHSHRELGAGGEY